MVFIDFVKNSFKSFFFKEDAMDNIDDNISLKAAFFSTWLFHTLVQILIIISGYKVFMTSFMAGITYSLSSILGIIFYPLIVFLSCGVIYVLLYLVGARGSFKTTLKFFLVISLVPTLVSSFLMIGINLLPSLAQQIFIGYSLVGIILMIWILILSLKVYSAIHEISKLRVFFALFVIPTIIAIIIFGIILLFFMSLFQQF